MYARSPIAGLRRRLRLLWGSTSGATAVETALVLPILITFLIGIFELGWAFQCGSSVREAVEQSSRALISTPEMTNAQLTEKVNARLSDLPIKNLTLTISQESVFGNARVARVSWNYDYAMALPLVPSAVFHFGSSLVVPRADA